MRSLEAPNDSLAFSYLELRKAIGVIGLLLPAAVSLGTALATHTALQSSLSAYYYTPMRDVFVGALCSIGVFLLSYRGPERIDAVAGSLASAFALGVALFPCTPPVRASAASEPPHIFNVLHYLCAACLFALLAFFSLVLFRRTRPDAPPTPRKLQRNRIYTVCGSVILVCIVLLAGIGLLPGARRFEELHPVFVLESLAVVAFGFSWLVKGEAILADRNA